jgi:hypothetical protein
VFLFTSNESINSPGNQINPPDLDQYGTKYYYQVSAVTTGGRSTPPSPTSNTVTYTLPPANVRAVASGTNAVTVSWNAALPANSSGTTYHVQRSVSVGGGYANVPQGTCSSTGQFLSCTDTQISAGTNYYYKVSATPVGGGESAFSPAASALVQTAPPTGLVATPQSTSAVVLSWPAAVAPAGFTITYKVVRAENSLGTTNPTTLGSPTCSGSPLSCTLTDTQGQAGKTFFYFYWKFFSNIS